MLELRRQAQGAGAPWVPTLLVVDENGVCAWTGAALTMKLARLLGPVQLISVGSGLGA